MKSGKLISFSVLNFLICKTEILIIPCSSGTLRVNKNVYKIYDIVPDTEQCSINISHGHKCVNVIVYYSWTIIIIISNILEPLLMVLGHIFMAIKCSHFLFESSWGLAWVMFTSLDWRWWPVRLVKSHENGRGDLFSKRRKEMSTQNNKWLPQFSKQSLKEV